MLSQLVYEVQHVDDRCLEGFVVVGWMIVGEIGCGFGAAEDSTQKHIQYYASIVILIFTQLLLQKY